MGSNLAYIPDGYPAVPVAGPQAEVEISPFAPHHLPVKFVPYGANDVQHPPPVSLDEISSSQFLFTGGSLDTFASY